MSRFPSEPRSDKAGLESHPQQGDALTSRFLQTREWTEKLCEPLSAEDCAVQSMVDASPAKWHLAHTTWFFETFLLRPYLPKYQVFHRRFSYLFNSYYNAVGDRHPRPQRGMLTRPPLEDVFAYRAHIDRHMAELLDTNESIETARLIEIGIHHEQQHQELLLTDVKHLLSCNPLLPAYREEDPRPICGDGTDQATESQFFTYEGGVREIGHRGDVFCYDNERPRHEVLLSSFRLAARPVGNAEYAAFIDDGGYRRPELWLSLGWDIAQRDRWERPMYWADHEGREAFTLYGARPLDAEAPVSHLSFYEADAFARWSGKRLPTEAEWEIAAADLTPETVETANLAETNLLEPIATNDDAVDRPAQMLGDVWEWTASPYVGYPGYRPPAGALGEYNGKFMSNQMVLRGGSAVTPQSHVRKTYRNFFPPEARWQFGGFRLAEDA
ncbi:ergothioneine biosynthesis protein EgtB [Stratiformator vulcanicus]|uniref:Iron(II)-dependent oxidoreductase EgtB n=1 Tax=Stratiformator vulcanicus TaxID=2527980 RepID=A0A517QZL8_9PLAN|nr:ergothioneine biosynthesis protein EgtB [Stratiformator vulcanicus]QDT37043.1 Iron(II)-dependent oxidoreductase EgtB [Stratiformator vulcanicus]